MEISSYILAKKYVDATLVGAGALVGKSAYDIACENGFQGTPAEWLLSLKGETPQIGPNGTWVIGNIDTGIVVAPDLAGYVTEQYIQDLLDELGLSEGTLNMIALTETEILEICK